VTTRVPSDTELAVLAVRVAAGLLGRGQRVATAESCSGGYVGKLLTDVPGSSHWFECGFITYSNESKRRMLGVSPETLSQHGAVSEKAVIEMAVGALAASSAERSVAISGVAGPDGGTEAHPLGDVWFAKAGRDGPTEANVMALRRRFTGDRDAVRRKAAAFALEMLLEG
jgi:nicotinamide-nucleotide amidase